jgi:putative transcriptional regulator
MRVPSVDVRSLRERLNLTQAEFAAKYGFPLATVRNWEQGRREPELYARILLAVLDRDPRIVERVLSV